MGYDYFLDGVLRALPKVSNNDFYPIVYWLVADHAVGPVSETCCYLLAYANLKYFNKGKDTWNEFKEDTKRDFKEFLDKSIPALKKFLDEFDINDYR